MRNSCGRQQIAEYAYLPPADGKAGIVTISRRLVIHIKILDITYLILHVMHPDFERVAVLPRPLAMESAWKGCSTGTWPMIACLASLGRFATCFIAPEGADAVIRKSDVGGT